MEEIWKDIEGYEKIYQVSNLGRVKSLSREIKHRYKNFISKEKILKNGFRNGYKFVCLSKNNKIKYFSIHRLVAETFIKNLNNNPQVNHITEIKTDNRVENLEWCDQRYNNTFGTRIKRTIQKNTKPVLQIKNNEIIKIWISKKELEENGYKKKWINRFCKNKYHSKFYKGYEWKYLENVEI